MRPTHRMAKGKATLSKPREMASSIPLKVFWNILIGCKFFALDYWFVFIMDNVSKCVLAYNPCCT